MTLLKFATILGFVGMQRPHTLGKLTRESFTLVVRDAYSPQYSSLIKGSDGRKMRQALSVNQTRFTIVGYFIRFKAKALLDAVAYFPNLSDTDTFYRDMCPVLALREVVEKG